MAEGKAERDQTVETVGIQGGNAYTQLKLGVNETAALSTNSFYEVPI
jgi:hypothetical protein